MANLYLDSAKSLQSEMVLRNSDFWNNLNVSVCFLCPNLISNKEQAYYKYDWLGLSTPVELEKTLSPHPNPQGKACQWWVALCVYNIYIGTQMQI